MPSLSNRRRTAIGKLTQAKHRRRQGQMLVEGVRAVEAAVAAGAPLTEILVTAEAAADPRVARFLERAAAPAHVLSPDALAVLSDVQTSQGVLAVARIEAAPEERLRAAQTLLVLDGVQDPGNVGTLLRTAAWFGVEAVAAGRGTAGLHGPKVVRAAMGAHWDLALARTPDAGALLDRLRAAGFACYGADLDGTPAGTWAPRRPSALVVGSEAHGLSTAVQGRLDGHVALHGAPTRRGTESLNVAVAGGILLYEWMGG